MVNAHLFWFGVADVSTVQNRLKGYLRQYMISTDSKVNVVAAPTCEPMVERNLVLICRNQCFLYTSNADFRLIIPDTALRNEVLVWMADQQPLHLDSMTIEEFIIMADN